jgi:hypothetical protein
MERSSAGPNGPLQVELDGRAARRLLSAVLAVASRSGMTAARAGAVQTLGTQLGLSFKVVAELSAAAQLDRPASRAEAEVTYLAAAVVIGPGAQDREALAQLGAALDLGVATRELDRLASSPRPLEGLKRAARLSSSSGERRALGARPGASSSRRLRPSLPVQSEVPAGGGQRRVLPPWARHPLPAGAALVVAAGLLGVLAARVAHRRPAAERATLRSTRDRYDDVIRAWNRALSQHSDVVPFDTLTTIRGNLVSLRDEARLGSEEDVALSAAITSFVDSGELAVEWGRSIEKLQEQVDDAIQLDAEQERFDEARRRLDLLPPAVDAAWRRERLQRVDAWATHSTRVHEFLRLHPTASGIDDLRRAMHLRDAAGVAKGGRAHIELDRWFRAQRALSDSIFVAYLHAPSPEDERTLLSLLQLVETDIRAYLLRKSPAELELLAARIAASAWLSPLERAALRRVLLGR